MRPPVRSSRVALIVVVPLLLAIGCGADGSPEASAPHAPGFDVTSLADLNAGLILDYVPAASPVELQEWSKIVLVGRVTDVLEGRTLRVDDNNPEWTQQSLIFVIEPSDVIKGDLPPGSDGSIYMELEVANHVPPADVAALIPPDARFAVYLDPARPDDDPMLNDGKAGRPEGQPLWRPVNPQGLVMSTPEGTQVVFESPQVLEVDLDAFLPPAKSFPARADATRS